MQITDANFDEVVLRGNAPVLVDFWASWCPPCKAMEPLVERLRNEFAGRVAIVGLNIDRNPQAAACYKIENVPAFLLFAGGREIARRCGAQTERQLRELIESGAPLNRGDDSAVAGQDWIAVVSGLPRSGTSMMMQMLDAGGVRAFTDGLRAADENNPNGYFELEAVKRLAEDASWLASAGGSAVKIIYKLLPQLPGEFKYRVVFMRRDMQEVLASQRAMLARSGLPASESSDQRMAQLFEQELRHVQQWMSTQSNVELLELSYNRLLEDCSPQLGRLNQFFDGRLDVESMAAVLDKRLYRQRVA